MQQASRANAPRTNNGGERTPVHFAGEFIRKDGDVAVVRFPYHSMDDIEWIPTHLVEWPGSKYGKRVLCTSEETHACPLCADGAKVDYRVFAKFITYTTNPAGEVVLNSTVWDRPGMFGDTDLKNLFEEYGDISQMLFKIKRCGTGTGTRYNIQPVINNTVYPPDVYVANFEELNTIEPKRILAKTMAQYEAIMNAETASQAPAQQPAPQPAAQPAYQAPAYQAPVQQSTAQPSYQAPAPTAQPAYQAPATEAPRRTVSYKF